MSDPIKCPSCHGRKIIMGLGLMEHTCEECKGIGYINAKEEEKTLAAEPAEEVTESVVKKKAGRPKRQVNG